MLNHLDTAYYSGIQLFKIIVDVNYLTVLSLGIPIEKDDNNEKPKRNDYRLKKGR